MPHLSQLQRDYEDQHVTVIGVTSEDRTNTLDKVEAMVEDKGDVMDYAVAWDHGRETYEAWMEAAGRKGIPTAFLVDQEGNVAWIGHPSRADIPLARVVAGEWDYVEGPELMQRIADARGAIYEALVSDPEEALRRLDAFVRDYPDASHGLEDVRFEILARLPDRRAEAKEVGRAIVEHAVETENAAALNSFAWVLVDPEVERTDRFLDLALRAASAADELSDGEDGAVLDTLARVWFWKGDLEKAVAIQERAVEHAEGSMKGSLQDVLEEYREALSEEGKT